MTKTTAAAECPSDAPKPYTVLVANEDGVITEIHREADLDSADTRSEMLKMEKLKLRECMWIMVLPRDAEDRFID